MTAIFLFFVEIGIGIGIGIGVSIDYHRLEKMMGMDGGGGSYGGKMGDANDRRSMDRKNVVVCDNGTGFVKCGFAGDNFPAAVFPCMVGRPMLRYEEALRPNTLKDLVVGQRCSELRHQLEVTYPIKNGIVQDWDDMGSVWDHTFFDILKLNPPECKILLTDPPLNPRRNRERMVETMFEKYGFRAMYIQVQAVLTLYAQGLLTGLVVDSGDGVSHVVPVVDGFAFPHLTNRLNVAGRHITAYLVDLLLRRGYAFNRTADFETVRELKEQLCYVSYDYKREMRLARETTVVMKTYTLPDGRVIKIGQERFQAPEALFSPELIDVESEGLPDMVLKCIQGMDIDNRMALYQHIVLSGGTTMYPGFPTRLEKEIRELYCKVVLKGNAEGMRRLRLRIEDAPYRKHTVYLGGAVLADIMKDKPEFWISKMEYQEQGLRRHGRRRGSKKLRQAASVSTGMGDGYRKGAQGYGMGGGGYGVGGGGGAERASQTTMADRMKEEVREHKLYVGNLDHRLTEYHVIKMFTPFGKIKREEYMWHTHGPRRGEPRGFAFVEFSKREVGGPVDLLAQAAEAALPHGIRRNE
ncbi:hypothetical protein CBR_g40116 [Chara braunii]|uniref:Actin-related protein 2 n=1 Tax=Chara braunii TaxID=69332 RepID=A0A388LT83_CHABU|nr:hypothetical protein CBR_g40116 [Chara braunii]|eukprot:GBG85475.1 hypothetical protein CBR_g40116 [Chara braunii]